MVFDEFDGTALQFVDHHLADAWSIHACPIWSICTAHQFLVRISAEVEDFLFDHVPFWTWNWNHEQQCINWMDFFLHTLSTKNKQATWRNNCEDWISFFYHLSYFTDFCLQIISGLKIAKCHCLGGVQTLVVCRFDLRVNVDRRVSMCLRIKSLIVASLMFTPRRWKICMMCATIEKTKNGFELVAR